MDKSFLTEEVRNDYRVTEDIKQLWAIELDLIEKLKDVCDRNNLKYFIDGGTLLGAVRHQGFIPWDDDVDIVMPRKDFEKLKKIAPYEFSEPYFLQTEDNDPDIFLGGYAKLRNSNTTMFEHKHIEHSANFGVWIDIFILDYLYEDISKRRKQIKKIRYLQRLIYAKTYREHKVFLNLSPFKWTIYKIQALFCSRNWLCKQLMKVSTCCKESSLLASFHYSYSRYWPVFFEKENYAEATLLDFEFLKLPAPIGYDRVLKSLYGNDYMEYPPLEQRRPHHNVIFEPDIPYKNYLIRFDRFHEVLKNKTIVIFGAGKMLEHYLEHEGKKYPPEFAVDNNSGKWGTEVSGIPVRQPDAILDVPTDNLCLIICSIYYREIAKQLRTMGIKQYYIYVQDISWL